MQLDEFVEAVVHYRLMTNASTTSWGRTRKHNAHVDGVPHSAHLVDLAVDVIYDDLPPRDWRLEMAKRLGLRLIIEPDHDHLQPLGWQKG